MELVLCLCAQVVMTMILQMESAARTRLALEVCSWAMWMKDLIPTITKASEKESDERTDGTTKDTISIHEDKSCFQHGMTSEFRKGLFS